MQEIARRMPQTSRKDAPAAGEGARTHRLRAAARSLALAVLTVALLHAGGSTTSAGPPANVCVDFGPTMDPLAFGGGCYPVTGPGEDALYVVGRAIVEDHYAAIGTTIEAFAGDQPCGAASMEFRTFTLRVSGAGEQPGCAQPGQDVLFRIGGLPAAQTMTWAAPAAGAAPVFLSLSVEQDHAWYWSERLLAHPPAIGTSVQAVVGDSACGETTIDVVPRGFPMFIDELRGFWKLVVPSSCGSGAEVSFAVHGARSIAALPWQPGVQQIDLILAGDPNCDLVVASTDAALVLQLQAGLLHSALACQPAADANRDGSANAIDATLVLQFAAGLLHQLPPG